MQFRLKWILLLSVFTIYIHWCTYWGRSSASLVLLAPTVDLYFEVKTFAWQLAISLLCYKIWKKVQFFLEFKEIFLLENLLIWFLSGFLPVHVWFSSRFFAWFPACFWGFRQINVRFILVYYLFVIGLSFSFLEHCDIVTFDPLLWWNIQREDQFWTRKGVNTRIYNVQAQQNLADVVHSITFWAMYCVINANVCPWGVLFYLIFYLPT